MLRFSDVTICYDVSVCCDAIVFVAQWLETLDVHRESSDMDIPRPVRPSSPFLSLDR